MGGGENCSVWRKPLTFGKQPDKVSRARNCSSWILTRPVGSERQCEPQTDTFDTCGTNTNTELPHQDQDTIQCSNN